MHDFDFFDDDCVCVNRTWDDCLEPLNHYEGKFPKPWVTSTVSLSWVKRALLQQTGDLDERRV